MKTILIFLMLLVPSFVKSEDGLVVQFTIEEQADGSNTQQTYTNALLMTLNETHSFDFENLYTIKFKSRTENRKSVNLVVSIKDLSEGKPYYIGAKSLNIEIGSASSFVLNRNKTSYKIDIDTSYGKLP